MEYSMKKHLILVVDDEDIVVKNIRYTLEDTALYQVITANNGQEALALVNKHKRLYGVGKNAIACVITDIKMPIMGGIEFAKAVRAIEGFHYLPIILLSAYEDFDKWHAAVGNHNTAQVTEYLLKPVKEADLLRQLDEIVIQKKVAEVLTQTRENKYANRLAAIAEAQEKAQQQGVSGTEMLKRNAEKEKQAFENIASRY